MVYNIIMKLQIWWYMHKWTKLKSQHPFAISIEFSCILMIFNVFLHRMSEADELRLLWWEYLPKAWRKYNSWWQSTKAVHQNMSGGEAFCNLGYRLLWLIHTIYWLGYLLVNESDPFHINQTKLPWTVSTLSASVAWVCQDDVVRETHRQNCF